MGYNTWSKKKELAFRRAIYAAQVDRLDQNVGRLVKQLKEDGQYDNTLIIFLSDNGCSAGMGMYDMATYPTDHYFWTFLAYCAGVGGSCLIIGSAAGVAAMGMEKIDFLWYFKNVSWLALIGYLSGAGVFMLQHYLLNF